MSAVQFHSQHSQLLHRGIQEAVVAAGSIVLPSAGFSPARPSRRRAVLFNDPVNIRRVE